MKILIPQFSKTLYFLYFVFGILFLCAAIGIRITNRDGPGDLPNDFLIMTWASVAGLLFGVLTFLITSYELKNKILYCLWIFIRYFLSFVFLVYGFIKVAGYQFQNLLSGLDTRLLEHSKSDMGVAWFFFGHSNSYEMFLGWGETIAALLLLFRRTSILGALILLTIVSNIVAINYWYDVPVKINSTYYLLMTFWVLTYQHQRLFDFFIRSKSTQEPIYPEFSFSPRKLQFIKIANFVIILVIVGYTAWDNFYRFPKKYGLDKKSTLEGVWRVDKLNTGLADTLWTNKIKQAKFYFDLYGQGVIKNNNVTLSRFTYSERSDSIVISQISYNPSYEFTGISKRDSSSLEIIGQWAGKPTTITMGTIPEYSVSGNAKITHNEISINTDELAKFVGKYKIASGYTVSVILKDGRLYRITEDGSEAEMVPLGNNRFGYKGRPMYWQFYLSAGGEITDIVYTSYGEDYMVWRLGL